MTGPRAGQSTAEPPAILSLHHVTATVADARADLSFYRNALGLRLIKKTINFDNPAVYHLYYGDEVGTPGTLMTTFPYAGRGVPQGRHGTGQITRTRFSVPAESVGWWRERLNGEGLEVATQDGPFREPTLTVRDPSGLVIELVEAPDDRRHGWLSGGVPPERTIRGVHGVSFEVDDPDPSVAFLN